jgi:hypothetical protein
MTLTPEQIDSDPDDATLASTLRSIRHCLEANGSNAFSSSLMDASKRLETLATLRALIEQAFKDAEAQIDASYKTGDEDDQVGPYGALEIAQCKVLALLADQQEG